MSGIIVKQNTPISNATIIKEKQYVKFHGCRLLLGCLQPLGMTNGRIPDFAISASSTKNLQTAPRYGRLYTLPRDGHLGCWSSRRNVIGEWLQVDLGTVVMVTKIATQGRAADVSVDELDWVTQYTLEFSKTGTVFQQYGNNTVTNTSLETFRFVYEYDWIVRSRIIVRSNPTAVLS